MPLSNRQIETLITDARASLTAVRDHPEASQVMDAYAYPTDRLDDLLDLVSETEQAYVEQKVEYAEAQDATRILNELRGELYGTLSEHRRIARDRFRTQPRTLNALGLSGRTERGHGRLIQQATQFYKVLDDHPEFADVLAPYSVTEAARDTAKGLVKDVEQAKADQTTEAYEAEEATASRNALAGELRARMRSFNELAAIGLGKHPQLSELVGITDPGE